MAASLNSNANVVASDGALNNLCDRDQIYDADCGADSFATENNGTAKFMGNTSGALGGSNSGDTGENIATTSSSCTGAAGGSGIILGAGLTTSGGETLSESCNNLNEFGAACSGLSSGKFDFHTMKATNNQTSRIELPRSELLKMLFYLEGELQARDVVIAALRNERVKHLITQLRSNPIGTNDPQAAMFRDKIALSGNLISRQSSTIAVQAEMEVRLIIEQQMESLYQMVHKQRATHVRMVGILTESLDNNQRMLQELEEEKRKHEHDTAQGDDITYGLEMERTKLRQELETERQQVKKLEKDLKKLQETLDFERSRQKQIVLLLIAERKKILMKYIEEGKRSEDLAQILSEEKQRSDSIAEGLEEESKKSLRMEAEIEKQACAFDGERKSLKLMLAKDEQRIKELENQLTQLKTENDALRKHYQQQQQHQQNPALTSAVPLRLQQATQNVAITNLQTKSSARPLNDDCGSLVVNIAKIVQPTATVSSVPVSGPTTGIARSISPGQSLRSSATGVVAPGFTLGNSILNDQQQNINSTSPIQTNTASSVSATSLSLLTSATASSALSQSAATNATSLSATPSVKHLSSSSLSATGNAPALGHIGGVASGGTQISMAAMQRVGVAPTIGGGGKFSTSSALCSSSSAAAAAAASNSDKILPNNATSLASSASPAAGVIQNNVNVATVIGGGIGTTSTQATRGVPPPIPPNKPVVPPKREPSLSRLPSVVVNSATAAAIAAAAASATTSSSPVLLPSSSSSSAIGSSVSGGGGGGAVTQAVTNVSATTVANSK